MHTLSLRGEVIVQGTEAVGFRPQDRVAVVDRGLQHRMFPHVSTAENGILESVGQ